MHPWGDSRGCIPTMSPCTPPSMGRAAITPGPSVPPNFCLLIPPSSPHLFNLNLVTNKHPKRRKKTNFRKVQGRGDLLYLPAVLPFGGDLEILGGPGIPKRCSEKARGASGMLAQSLLCRSRRTGQAGETLAPAPQAQASASVPPPRTLHTPGATSCLWHNLALVVPRGIRHLH